MLFEATYVALNILVVHVYWWLFFCLYFPFLPILSIWGGFPKIIYYHPGGCLNVRLDLASNTEARWGEENASEYLTFAFACYL